MVILKLLLIIAKNVQKNVLSVQIVLYFVKLVLELENLLQYVGARVDILKMQKRIVNYVILLVKIVTFVVVYHVLQIG